MIVVRGRAFLPLCPMDSREPIPLAVAGRGVVGLPGPQHLETG